MKIIFLTRLYLPHIGGVEKHIFEISKILAKNNQLTIIAEQDNPSEPEYEKAPFAEIYRIPLGGVGESAKKFTIWSWLFKHLDLIKSAEIVHIHDVFFWYLPFRFLFPNKKVFITFHGYEGSQPPTLIQKFWHQLAAKLTSGNICIGDFHQRWYGIKPTLVSYGAVYPVSQTKHRIRKEAAIFIGRLDRDTGIVDYLEASRQLRLPLDVYGDGPLLSACQLFVQSNRVPARFYGFVPDSANFIPGYKYAFISRYLGILEALAAHTSIIAHFDSPIKKDYLALAPFAQFIHLVNSSPAIVATVAKIRDNYPTALIRAGYIWSQGQTWAKLADQYQSLWTLPK